MGPFLTQIIHASFQVPGSAAAAGEANPLLLNGGRMGKAPPQPYKRPTALATGLRRAAAGGREEGDAPRRFDLTGAAGGNSSSSGDKDKGQKQLEDIRRMLSRKQEVAKMAGRLMPPGAALFGERRHSGTSSAGGGGSSDGEDFNNHPSRANSARVSRTVSLEEEEEGGGGGQVHKNRRTDAEHTQRTTAHRIWYFGESSAATTPSFF
jgi:hypothetical protein